MIRVLLHDTHRLIGAGIKEVLEADDDIRVAGVEPTLAAVPSSCKDASADVVVMRVDRADPEILEILSSLARFPTSSVMYCMNYGEGFAAQAVKAGASGCLGRSTTPEELVEAVKGVREGRRFISPELGAEIAGRTEEGGPRLSTREFEVLLGLAAGQSVTSIASELSLSTKTVSTYRSRLLEKLGLKTTAELIRYALERGLT